LSCDFRWCCSPALDFACGAWFFSLAAQIAFLPSHTDFACHVWFFRPGNLLCASSEQWAASSEQRAVRSNCGRGTIGERARRRWESRRARRGVTARAWCTDRRVNGNRVHICVSGSGMTSFTQLRGRARTSFFSYTEGVHGLQKKYEYRIMLPCWLSRHTRCMHTKNKYMCIHRLYCSLIHMT
jgi:hypothetical protein